MIKFATALKENGITVPVVATGATPTAVIRPHDHNGVNELHPGNYVFLDAYQATIGTCKWEDCALSVMCRVMSKYNHPHNRLLVDTGAFALSKDSGPNHIGQYNQYGVIVGHPDLKITYVSQELGIVVGDPPLDLDKYPIGTLFRIIPNHSCMATNCYEHINILKDGVIIDQWKVCPRHH